MKKAMLIFISLILVTFISACDGNMGKNYAPDPSEYVEWDGNYFYYKNYRCSTDLKVEEPHITEITYNDKTYAIDEVNDCTFKDDKLHMTFCFEVGEFEKWTAYTIYSLENKEVEYLYIYEHTSYDYEIDLNKILDISDNYAVISGTGKISKIDITSNEIETIYCDSYEVKNGYAVIKDENELLASTIEDFEFEKIMDLSNVSSRFDYYIHNVDDKPYLQIIDQTSSNINGQYLNTNSMTYYDFESKNFYELVKFEDNKTLSIDSNNTSMFMLGEPKIVGYNGYTTDDKHLEYKLFIDNSILYTVEFSEDDGLELKELYRFESTKHNEEYTINKIENNIIYLNKRYFNKPQNHMYYNRIDNSVVYFDIAKNSFIDEEEHDYDSKIILAEYGNIVYYVKTKRQGVYMAQDNIHYYLYRFDKTTQEEGLLRYFLNHLNDLRFDNYFCNNEQNDLEILVRNS